MIRRFLAASIDEAFGLMLLHKVLRFGDRPPVQGDADVAGLRSGDPRTFFAPAPAPADLESNRREIARTEHAVVEDFSFASSVSTPFLRNNVVRGRLGASRRAAGVSPPSSIVESQTHVLEGLTPPARLAKPSCSSTVSCSTGTAASDCLRSG